MAPGRCTLILQAVTASPVASRVCSKSLKHTALPCSSIWGTFCLLLQLKERLLGGNLFPEC